MALQPIDQLNRSAFGTASRPADERDNGFSDLLRRSVDRLRELHHVERRQVPRGRSEIANPAEADTGAEVDAELRVTRRSADDAGQSEPGRVKFRKLGFGRDASNSGQPKSGNEDKAPAEVKPAAETDKVAAPVAEDGIAVAADIEDTVEIIAKDPNASERAPSDAVVAFVATDTTVTIVPVVPQGTAGNSTVPVEGSQFDAVEVAGIPLASMTPPPVLPPQSDAEAKPAAHSTPFAPVLNAFALTAESPKAIDGVMTELASATPLPAVPVANPSEPDRVETSVQLVLPQIVPSAAPGAPAVQPTTEVAPQPVVTQTTVQISATVMAPVPPVAEQSAEATQAMGLPVAATVVVADQAKQLVSRPTVAPALPVEEVQADDAAAAPALPTTPNAAAAETADPDPVLPLSGNANVAANPSANAANAASLGFVSPGAVSGVTTGSNQPDAIVATSTNGSSNVAAAVAELTAAAGTAEQAELAAPVDADVEAPTAHQNFVAHLQNADQSNSSSRASAPHQQQMAQLPERVADQVAVHISKALKGGDDRIKIELRPAALGHIEVQLKLAADGHVQAVIAADKPETLELMQRDARGLERALNDAGLKTDSGSLSFNLRGQDSQRDQARNEFSGRGGRGGVDVVRPEDDISAVEAMVALSRTNGGIDLRV